MTSIQNLEEITMRLRELDFKKVFFSVVIFTLAYLFTIAIVIGSELSFELLTFEWFKQLQHGSAIIAGICFLIAYRVYDAMKFSKNIPCTTRHFLSIIAFFADLLAIGLIIFLEIFGILHLIEMMANSVAVNPEDSIFQAKSYNIYLTIIMVSGLYAIFYSFWFAKQLYPAENTLVRARYYDGTSALYYPKFGEYSAQRVKYHFWRKVEYESWERNLELQFMVDNICIVDKKMNFNVFCKIVLNLESARYRKIFDCDIRSSLKEVEKKISELIQANDLIHEEVLGDWINIAPGGMSFYNGDSRYFPIFWDGKVRMIEAI